MQFEIDDNELRREIAEDDALEAVIDMLKSLKSDDLNKVFQVVAEMHYTLSDIAKMVMYDVDVRDELIAWDLIPERLNEE